MNDTLDNIQHSKESNGIGTAGFILSIGSYIILIIPIFNLLSPITWLLGLIFSAIGISKAKRVNSGKGLSIAGLIISLFGIFLFIIAIILLSMGLIADQGRFNY